MKQESLTQQQNARHLAARAVMAYRSGFPIESVSISINDNTSTGIVCDWKQLRATYSDDGKLLRRGFAFIYIGTIIDQELIEPASDALRKEVHSDQSSALEARKTAVEWGLARSVTETDPFAHGGYKLASRLLRNQRSLVDALLQELCTVEVMSQHHLQSWFDHHADPLVLDDLEQSISY